MNLNLKSLPRLTPPAGLETQLRVLASREALRRRRHRSLGDFVAHAWSEALLLFNNLMRPYAVPCAGGLLSTAFLFGLVAPSLAVNRNIRHDVPTAIRTPASLEFSVAFHFTSESMDEISIDVNIDADGRVTGYSIPLGQGAWTGDPELRRSLESTLLYTKFTPATFFGQPATGKTRITIRRNSVDVRG